MTEVVVTRQWVREWVWPEGPVPEHWLYRCSGFAPDGRRYVTHSQVNPQMVDDVGEEFVETYLRDAWSAHLRESLGEPVAQPPAAT